jgi:hypothetical protein
MDLEGDVHVREGNSDSDDADSYTALYRLAYIKEIPVETDGWLLCRVRNKGGHRVIAANQIQKLIGFMKRGNDQYVTCYEGNGDCSLRAVEATSANRTPNYIDIQRQSKGSPQAIYPWIPLDTLFDHSISDRSTACKFTSEIPHR